MFIYHVNQVSGPDAEIGDELGIFIPGLGRLIVGGLGELLSLLFLHPHHPVHPGQQAAHVLLKLRIELKTYTRITNPS
jgi:hypothetical protein